MKQRKAFLVGILLHLVLVTPKVVVSSLGAEALPVTVSIAPLKYFVEHIAGSRAVVQVMVPAGADPHVYEPRPQQMKALVSSKVYFAVGVQFEKIWLERFARLNPELVVLHTEEGICRLPAFALNDSRQPRSHDPRHDDLADPHIWTAPHLVMHQARNILLGLLRVDPRGRAVYEAGYRRLIADLVELDLELQRTLSPLKERCFLSYHPAWRYFARAYGLEQIAVELEGKEPKPTRLQELIALARGQNLKILLVQPQVSLKSARVLAREIGAKLVTADPLAPDWAGGLRRLATSLAGASAAP